MSEWIVRISCWAIIIGMIALALKRNRSAEVIIAVCALVVAIMIPLQIDQRDRAIERLRNCTSSILALREELLQYYRLPNDEYGNVVDGDSPDDKIPLVRTQMQNAKDSTYTLCSFISAKDGALLDRTRSPWSDAPISVTSTWSRNNVSDMYSWSTDALKRGTEIPPQPIEIPYFNVTFWPEG